MVDFNPMPMTLLNATNFIMRHQRYLLQDNDHYAAAAATDVHQTSGNEGITAKPGVEHDYMYT